MSSAERADRQICAELHQWPSHTDGRRRVQHLLRHARLPAAVQLLLEGLRLAPERSQPTVSDDHGTARVPHHLRVRHQPRYDLRGPDRRHLAGRSQYDHAAARFTGWANYPAI
jgi:hypothetical protein